MPEIAETTITNGELSRAVGLIRSDIRDLKKEIDARPTAKDIGYLEQRIKDLEDWQKWAMRIGVPALIGVIFNIANTLDGKIPG